jgi:hypothetical protein
MLRKKWALIFLILIGVSAGAAQAAPVDSVASRCDASTILPHGLAVTTSTAWKPAYGDLPAFCEVSAILSPAAGSHIGVIYRLPERWNGRLLRLGGGGQAGNVTLEVAAEPLRLGYATAQTDAGHPSNIVWDTGWSVLADGTQNWPALEDFCVSRDPRDDDCRKRRRRAFLRKTSELFLLSGMFDGRPARPYGSPALPRRL